MRPVLRTMTIGRLACGALALLTLANIIRGALLRARTDGVCIDDRREAQSVTAGHHRCALGIRSSAPVNRVVGNRATSEPLTAADVSKHWEPIPGFEAMTALLREER